MARQQSTGMKKGKHLQIGAGSRSKSQAKAEDKARSARHRRDKKQAIKDQTKNS